MSENLAYQESSREELIGGRLVAMSPRPSVNHSQVASNIYYLFAHYLRGKTCRPFADGVDLYLDDENRFVPDFMVVCDPDKIKMDGVYGAPDLVAEVLSPSTAKYDRGHKKDLYARCGVQEYWLADPANKSVEVYRLNGQDLSLYDVYAIPCDWELAQMTNEERSALPSHFKCSLYDDLDITLDDIFYRTF